MKLCAIVKNGKIKGVVPVPDEHDFGVREAGYAHIQVQLLKQMPAEYNDNVRAI